MATGKVTKIADLPPFRVGDVFPADQKTASLVRFIVATRPLVTVARLLRSRSSDPQLARIDGDHLLLASIADAKEALDAFRNADQQKCFIALDKHADCEMRKRLRRLRRHRDPDRARSFYSIIKTARDQAGGHWKQGVAEKALTDLENATFEIWVGDREDGAAASGFLPLAHEIALRMSGIFDASKLKQKRRMHLLSKLQGDLFHVAGAAYTLALRYAYTKKQWS